MQGRARPSRIFFALLQSVYIELWGMLKTIQKNGDPIFCVFAFCLRVAVESVFWTNTVWYVLLGLVTVVQVTFTLRRAENRRQAVALYITLLGMTLWLETFLLVVFKSYAYYPGIITDPAHAYDDILAGNLFSQFSIAASMLTVAVLRLKFRWCVALAVAYGVVEELFLALGIYEHFWYRTYFTVALLPFAFLLARKMHDRLKEGLKPVYYYGYVFFSLFALNVITLDWGLMLADVKTTSHTLLPDPHISRYGVTVLQHVILASSLMLAYFTSVRWRWKALIMLALEIAYFVLYRNAIIIIRHVWFIPVSAATILWTYASIVLMDRLYGLGGPARLKLHKRYR